MSDVYRILPISIRVAPFIAASLLFPSCLVSLLLHSFLSSSSQFLLPGSVQLPSETMQTTTALLSLPTSASHLRRRSLAVRCSDEAAPLEDPPILGTKIVLPRKKPLKWSTGTAPGEYGGPPTTSGLRRYFTLIVLSFPDNFYQRLDG